VLQKNCDLMNLEKYKEKRDFKKTNEPKAELTKSFCEKIVEKYKDIKFKRPIYLIHEHWASHHHYDLRLEFNGVLKSWAVPKNPELSKSKKILAIQVEDHPIEYAAFSGIIPPGNYGAGKVERWDIGTFELIDKKENKIVLKINGKKLKGIYVLVKFKSPNNWLFFKKKE